MDILTIDVGGTYIKYGLIDNQLNITNKDKIPKVNSRMCAIIIPPIKN